ncbi:MAG TPA: BNR-repeat neuraminidase N-terminal domain-containing protein [Bacteroidia bacterium]|nr:BNR-repeat neuraminidase N-terminal domain-containing protein [Bacteroidia bacterium]HNT79729.1 BNR-repeat neuraminidase N-terminal domain-containing protein [Bacteroidia bacterium]
MFKPKKNKKLQQKVSLSQKLLIAITVGIASMAIFIIVMLFYFADEEQVKASDQMVFMYAEAFQKDQLVFKGNKNQVLIGVVIETTGKGNPLKLNNIRFRVSGSPVAPSKVLQNIRLWSTGSSKNYEALKPQGNSILNLESNDIVFNTTMILSPGLNYVWLTADILDNAPSKSIIDAECVSLKVGVIEFLPLIAAPEGAMTIAFHQPVYSSGSFAFSNSKGWSKSRASFEAIDIDGKTPRVYFIQQNHRVNVNVISRADVVIVERGGLLNINNELQADELIVLDGGTVKFESDQQASGIRKFLMEGKSRYSHYSITRFPFKTWIVSEQSTIEFNEMPESCFAPQNGWSNIIVASHNNKPIILQESLNSINGNLMITSSSEDPVLVSNQIQALNVNANFELYNAKIIHSNVNNQKVMVSGNLVLNNSIWDDSNNSKGVITSLKGNFINSSSKFISNSSSNFIFSGSKTHFIKQKESSIQFGTAEIEIKSSLAVLNETNLQVLNRFTVMEGAAIDLGASKITGSGTFELKRNASIRIGHKEGLNSTENKGNIQTAKRIYSAQANYIYNGSANPQFTGVFETLPGECVIGVLGVEKDKVESWLVFEQDFTINQLRKNSGTLIQNIYKVHKSENLVQR